MDNQYIIDQLASLVVCNAGGWAATIKIWGNVAGHTNCMNVSEKQLEAIKQILLQGEE